MSTIKSSTEHLTLNADGSGKDIKFQANGVEKASISSAGAFTSTSIDATKLSGTVPNFTSTGIDDNATSTAITIDASENVGIGVVPESDWSETGVLSFGPQGNLWCDGGGGVWLSSNYRNVSGSGDRYIAANEASRFSQNNGIFTFQTAASGTADSAISWTNAMTINNSGDVYTGTSSLPADDNVVGVAAYRDGLFQVSRAAGHVLVVNIKGTTGGLIVLRKDGSIVGTITTNGSSTSYNTSSDHRLKENVVDMENATDRVKQLKPKRFNFIADDSITVDGFLAHEVQDIVPEAISGEKDAMVDEEYEVTPAVMDGDTVVTEAVMGTRSVPDYQGIDQSKLVPLLVASLQEAVAKIEALEARVTALEV